MLYGSRRKTIKEEGRRVDVDPGATRTSGRTTQYHPLSFLFNLLFSSLAIVFSFPLLPRLDCKKGFEATTAATATAPFQPLARQTHYSLTELRASEALGTLQGAQLHGSKINGGEAEETPFCHSTENCWMAQGVHTVCFHLTVFMWEGKRWEGWLAVVFDGSQKSKEEEGERRNWHTHTHTL